MTERDRLKSIMMDYADLLSSGEDPDPDQWADKLVGAVERPAGVMVKPLELSWDQLAPDLWRAETPIGRYFKQRFKDAKNAGLWWWAGASHARKECVLSRADEQVAADFARRVAECLTVPVLDREVVRKALTDAFERGQRGDGLLLENATDAILSSATTREEVEREVIERLAKLAHENAHDPNWQENLDGCQCLARSDWLEVEAFIRAQEGGK